MILSKFNHKVEPKLKYFKADPFSGVPGNLFSLSIVPVVVLANHLHKLFPWPFHGLVQDIKKGQCTEWIMEKKYKESCEKILNHAKSHGFGIFNKLNHLAVKRSEQFRVQAARLISKLPSLSNGDLKRAYDAFLQIYTDKYGIGITTFLFEHILSERLHASLSARHEKAAMFIHQALHSRYKSFMTKSDEALLKIKREKNRRQKDKLVDSYLDEHFFSHTSYEYSPRMTKKRITELASKTVPSANRQKEQNQRIVFSLDSTEKHIIGLLKIAEAMRDLRKKINSIGNYTMFRFLDEASRRSGVPIKIAENIFYFEYAQLLDSPKTAAARAKRRRFCTVLFDGKRPRYFEQNVLKPNNPLKITEVKGTPASIGAGKIRAPAKIILAKSDFGKLRAGDVLITQMTRPNFLPIMKRAAAIVTDEGGLTSHAAIVSRELGIPCIVGTRYATKAFKNGELIEVNAHEGTVIKIG